MTAIRDIDPAQCRQLRGFVFDVDDTLTRHGRVEREAYNALWSLREAGLHAIAVTGRPLGFAEILARTWPIDFAVGENGAGYIRVTEQAVIRGFYDEAAERQRQADLLERVRVRVAELAPWAQAADDQWARRCDLAFDIGERVQIEPARVTALRTIIEAEGARSVVSSVHAHAVAGDYDKALGVVHAARNELGLDLAADVEQWMFVGDSGNDAPAFAHFKLSAGVANVAGYLGSLPVPPAFVSEADRGRGFAEIVQTVLARRV